MSQGFLELPVAVPAWRTPGDGAPGRKGRASRGIAGCAGAPSLALPRKRERGYDYALSISLLMIILRTSDVPAPISSSLMLRYRRLISLSQM